MAQTIALYHLSGQEPRKVVVTKSYEARLPASVPGEEPVAAKVVDLAWAEGEDPFVTQCPVLEYPLNGCATLGEKYSNAPAGQEVPDPLSPLDPTPVETATKAQADAKGKNK